MSENLTNQLPPNAVKQILATLTAIDGRLTRLEERLTRLEDRVEQRSYDTRPMWDKVLVRLDGLEEQARLTTSRSEWT